VTANALFVVVMVVANAVTGVVTMAVAPATIVVFVTVAGLIHQFAGGVQHCKWRREGERSRTELDLSTVFHS